jgi:hypothetical protein
MQDVARGKIRNKTAATVVRDMSKLRWDNITPTDIDAFLDFGDRLFIIIEVKYGGHTMPHGQELAISRLCAASHSEARTAIAVQAMFLDRHLTEDNEVDYAACEVTQYRIGAEPWISVWEHRTVTLKEFIDELRESYL